MDAEPKSRQAEAEEKHVVVLRSVHFSISQQLLRRNLRRFRGGLVFQANRLMYHSTLGLRVIQKKKKKIPASRAIACHATRGEQIHKSIIELC